MDDDLRALVGWLASRCRAERTLELIPANVPVRKINAYMLYVMRCSQQYSITKLLQRVYYIFIRYKLILYTNKKEQDDDDEQNERGE